MEWSVGFLRLFPFSLILRAAAASIVPVAEAVRIGCGSFGCCCVGGFAIIKDLGVICTPI